MEKMKTLLMSICLLLVSAVSFAQVEEASGNVTDTVENQLLVPLSP